MEIIKEIPSWAIDWVNKVFTFINDIDYINDLWFDGAIYTSFSVNGNQITLTDAPTISIFADYFPLNSVIPVTTDVTFWDIKSKIWALLWQKPTSINFSTDIVWEEINRMSLKVWRGRVKNKLNWQIIRAWNLWFQEWSFTFRTKAWWIVTDIVNLWDTEIWTNTTNLLTSGYILLGGDIINYANKSATELTWVNGIQSQHLVWDKISQLYEVPTTFETMIWMQIVVNSSNWVYYKDVDLNNWRISYQILRTGTKVLLKVDWLENNTQIKIKFTKKYNKMVNDTDICVFPDDYWIDVLAYLVAWNLAYDKWMPTSERLLNTAYWNLQEMYQYFTNETKVIRQKLMPKPYWFNSIR